MRKLAPLALAAALAAPLAAVEFVVTRYDDPAPGSCLANDCSLREAILAANSSAGSDRIALSAGTYFVLLEGIDDTGLAGDLDVTDDLEITGPGASMTTIDGTAFTSGIEEPILAVSNADLQLRDLTLTDGEFGALWVDGSATIERCQFDSSGLTGDRYGVRIEVNSTASIRDSTVAGNGRGLLVVGSVVELTNTTLFGDRALDVAGDSAVSCSHCTIDDAALATPAVSVADSQLELVNSIVAGDCSTANGGTIVSLGGNLESPGTGCGFTLGSDLDGAADAGLTAMGDHGGPTRTKDLAADSQALGLGLSDDCTTNDQRGEQRKKLSFQVCDAGAVERATPPPPTPIFADGFEQGHDGAWSG